jgi:hypothetical protein
VSDTEAPSLHVLRNCGVVGIGPGSLLSDTGNEMATAARSGFLRSLGAPAAALGIAVSVCGVAPGRVRRVFDRPSGALPEHALQ